ncbi:MAG: hypothetical protein GXP45_05865 [bacterium]|nr:hypothetical protein [bacterium]
MIDSYIETMKLVVGYGSFLEKIKKNLLLLPDLQVSTLCLMSVYQKDFLEQQWEEGIFYIVDSAFSA